MNAIDFLTAQHRTLEGLLKEVANSKKAGHGVAGFQKVGDHLTTHITSEEQLFYPAVRAQRTEDILLESLEEHLSLKRLLADLLALDPAEKTFAPKFQVLKEQTEHHHKEEEEHLFPKVRSLLTSDALEKLGSEMEQLQQQMQASGAPRKAVVTQTAAAEPLHD
ncbi:hemerythrin domain-containing protein [soil metagenome]